MLHRAALNADLPLPTPFSAECYSENVENGNDRRVSIHTYTFVAA